ncbi:MAG: NUDIX hydrolase [Candidatus Moranbacteria bacterium]|nr:NUDIX hydrolase [Candidatus Moranbacteria bacterium]
MDKTKPKPSIPENSKKVFEGEIFDVYQWEQEMFDGSVETFEKLKRPDTANVLAFTEDGKVIIINEQQPGKETFFGLPGGRIEDGEDPAFAAKRELLEETGYVCDSIELWHSVQLIHKIDWTIYFFVARGCKKVAQQKLDAGEKIEVQLVDLDEFLEMVFAEKMKSSEFIMQFFKDDLVVIDKEKTFEKIKNYFNN